MLEEGWKSSIRFKNDIGKKEEAERDLMKIRFSEYENLNTEDKLFVSYCIALYRYQEKDKYMANKYIDEIRKIFQEKGNIKNYQVEYNKYLWLSVNLNHESMSIKNIVRTMLKVYKYYISVKDEERANSALFNIFGFKKDKEGIITSLKMVLSSRCTKDLSFTKNILEDCEKIDHNLYIEALDIIKMYIPDFESKAV